MTRKRRRLLVVLACGLGLGSATALVLVGLSRDVTYFLAPADVASKGVVGRTVRLGGLVQAGSLARRTDGGEPVARFRVTDGTTSVPVMYDGILPDLFREGQGAVMLGALAPDGHFQASEVLAKHDEAYMPPEVAAALKRSGRWRPEQGPPPPASSWPTESAAARGAPLDASKGG